MRKGQDRLHSTGLRHGRAGTVIMDCSKCGFANPEANKFRGECGAPLQSAASEAERRHLTVMFCDLADSTAMSERLDRQVAAA